MLFVAVFTCALIAMLYVFLPAAVFPYFAGAIVASAFWLVYGLFLESSGFGHKRSGILAEEWTAGELRSLRKHGWRVVNHVMLEHSDVDHALLGPGGFYAVETKFRSDWSRARQELDSVGKNARDSARKLALRMKAKPTDVAPLVVMWGAGVADEFDEAYETDGVIFCPGGRLREFLLAQPTRVPAEAVGSTFDHLDAYVERRDRGERKQAGLPPRTFDQNVNDAMLAAASWLICSLALLALARVEPAGIWAVAAGAAIVAGALTARRHWPQVRSQRVTTALLATAGGFSVLFAVALLPWAIG